MEDVKAMESKESPAERDEVESSKAPPQDEEIPSFNVPVDGKKEPKSHDPTEGEKATESKLPQSDRDEVESSNATLQDEKIPFINISVDEKDEPKSLEPSEDEKVVESEVPRADSYEVELSNAPPQNEKIPSVNVSVDEKEELKPHDLSEGEKATESKLPPPDRDEVESSNAPIQDEKIPFINVSVDEKDEPKSHEPSKYEKNAESKVPLADHDEVESSNATPQNEKIRSVNMSVDKKEELKSHKPSEDEQATKSKFLLPVRDEVKSSNAPMIDEKISCINVSVDEKDESKSHKPSKYKKNAESKVPLTDRNSVESSKAPLHDDEMPSINVSVDEKVEPVSQEPSEDEKAMESKASPTNLDEVVSSNAPPQVEEMLSFNVSVDEKEEPESQESTEDEKAMESKESPTDLDEVESSKAQPQVEEMSSFNKSVDEKEEPKSQEPLGDEKVTESIAPPTDLDEVESSKAQPQDEEIPFFNVSTDEKEEPSCLKGTYEDERRLIIHEVPSSDSMESSITSEVPLDRNSTFGTPKKLSDNLESVHTFGFTPKSKETMHEIPSSARKESWKTFEVPLDGNNTSVTPKKLSDSNKSFPTFGLTPKTKEAMHVIPSSARIESSVTSEALLDRNNTLVTPKKLSVNKELLQASHVTPKTKEASAPQRATPEGKQISPRWRVRIRKRKKHSSDSSSDEEMEKLPDNAIEVDRKLQEMAARNNLTQDGVRKILKKVVTNDHVLAYVALREEEEGSGTEDERREPKITRAKAKELTKHSPAQTAPWNLELTPIKHIPVKTTPEVTALMRAQDLPDESDEEYQPTNDDVLSDDDATLESCSDLDSQPRTPATPSSHPPESPQPEEKTDGPFKVPTLKPGGKKRRISEEEPTIARRTRSKLCLSETPIEHIEQSFVPPDELPAPSVDDLWSNFLTDVLHPTLSFRTEDDDEADPEYNVAADHDEYDEDEEALEQSLANISRKELDDLYNELMSITDAPAPKPVPIKMQVEEDQTPPEEDESNKTFFSLENVNADVLGVNNMVNTFHKPPIPIKEEQIDTEDVEEEERGREPRPPAILQAYKAGMTEVTNIVLSNKGDKIVEEVVVEVVSSSGEAEKFKKPRLLRHIQEKKELPQKVNIILNGDSEAVIDPTQVLILEQQLRQHIQIAAAIYLQINIHPMLWTYAPKYKEFLETLQEMADKQLAEGYKSVVDVCNLRPAVELVTCWEQTVNQDTPENKKMLEFLQKESEKCLRRNVQNIVYIGSFHDTFLETVSNSSVFVYPYLLPPVPFRCDTYRRQNYLPAEDRLIALGLEQFYEHVEANREVYKQRRSVTLTQVVALLVKHMMPWARPRSISYRIQQMRRSKDPDHPIRKFFEKKKVDPVQHKLLSFNPNMTLHEQPEYEMPLTWVKYISRLNKRASEFVMKRAQLGGHEPASIEIDIETREPQTVPSKAPLPVIQTTEANQQLGSISFSIRPLDKDSMDTDLIQPTPMALIQTDNGGFLLPITLVTQGGTVNSTKAPIVSTRVAEEASAEKEYRYADENSISSIIYHDDSNEDADTPDDPAPRSHCECCILMNVIKKKWSLITNYFTSSQTASEKRNCCVRKKSPKISRRLKYFLLDSRGCSFNVWQDVESRVASLEKSFKSKRDRRINFNNTFSEKCREDADETDSIKELQDQIWVASFINKLAMSCLTRNKHRKSLHELFKFFRIDHDCPVELYNKVSRLLSEESSDLVDEFLCLLTDEQAEQLGLYREYFVNRHLQEFTQLMRQEVKDPVLERDMLLGVSSALVKSGAAACEVCCALLGVVCSNRCLSEFVFHVTPHRIKNEPKTPPQNALKTVNIAPLPCPTTNNNTVVVTKRKRAVVAVIAKRRKIAKPAVNIGTSIGATKEPRATTLPIVTGTAQDIGINCHVTAAAFVLVSPEENSVQSVNTFSRCLPDLNATDPSLEVDTPELSISKTEVREYFMHSPDTSVEMDQGDQHPEIQVKIEPPDWSREEDKILLQALKLHGTPEETKQKTVLEVLEEKYILSKLETELKDKSEIHIRKRIKYLLQFLI